MEYDGKNLQTNEVEEETKKAEKAEYYLYSCVCVRVYKNYYYVWLDWNWKYDKKSDCTLGFNKHVLAAICMPFALLFCWCNSYDTASEKKTLKKNKKQNRNNSNWS